MRMLQQYFRRVLLPNFCSWKSHYVGQNKIFPTVISLDSEFGMNTRGFQEVHVNQVVFKASMLSWRASLMKANNSIQVNCQMVQRLAN